MLNRTTCSLLAIWLVGCSTFREPPKPRYQGLSDTGDVKVHLTVEQTFRMDPYRTLTIRVEGELPPCTAELLMYGDGGQSKHAECGHFQRSRQIQHRYRFIGSQLRAAYYLYEIPLDGSPLRLLGFDQQPVRWPVED